jgi:hypothetical protein
MHSERALNGKDAGGKQLTEGGKKYQTTLTMGYNKTLMWQD